MRELNKILNHRYFQYCLVMVFLLPLFWLNILDKHDWGGDFAQYIQQAINIIEGRAQNDTHYIFNPHNPYLAPPTYPVGFPIMLSPIIAVFGNSVIALSYYMTGIFIVLLLLSFAFLKKEFGFILSFVAILIFAYNPHMIILKGEIISDIPFTTFILFSVLLYRHNSLGNSWYVSVILGLVLTFTLLTRSIGFIVLIAIFLDQLILWYKEDKKQLASLLKRFKGVGLVFATTIVFYFLVTLIILPVQTENYQFYTSLFSFENLGETLFTTSDYYLQTFQNFFQYEAGKWNIIGSLLQAFAVCFLIIGFVSRSLKSFGVIELTFILYLGVILLFPNASQGFRYLLPMFPFMLYYMISGIRTIQLDIRVKQNYIAVAIFALVALQYKPGIHSITEKPFIWFGPQHPASQFTFEYIRANTPKDALIIFEKPRVLGLYTQRDSYNINKRNTSVSTARQINELGFDYILISEDLKNDSLNMYIDQHDSELKLVYERGLMKLYKRN